MFMSTVRSLLLAFVLSTTVKATTEVICDSSYPNLNSYVQCTCINKNKNDITWYMNNTTLTNCIHTINKCIPDKSGYNFSMTSNSVGSYFFATIYSYDYTYCGSYSCEDVNKPADVSSEHLWITDYDLSQGMILTEPALHQSGNITITTKCLFIQNNKDINGIITVWYKKENTTISRYDKANEESIMAFDNSACQSCNGNTSVQLIVSYFHKDENTSYEEVQFILHIYDRANTSNGKNITTSSTYRVKGYKVEKDGRRSIKDGTTTAVSVAVPVGVFCICVGIVIFATRPWMKAPETDLYCSSKTDSSITVTWKTDSARVKWNHFIVSWNMDNGRVKKSPPIETTRKNILQYTIKDLEERTNYYVTLEAKHCARTKKTDMIDVDTLGRPDPPLEFIVDVEGLTDRIIPVKWKSGYNGGYEQNIVINYSDCEHRFKQDANGYTIGHLTGRTKYKISICSTNKIGTSEALTREVTTKGIPDPPTNFHQRENDTGDSIITLQWEPGFNGGYPQKFKLTFSHNGDEEGETVEWKDEKIMKYNIKKLAEKTLYTFNIYAVNKVGRSHPLQPLTYKTGSKPEPPTQFTLAKDGLTNSSISVQWNAGKNGGYPQKFLLTYNEDGKKGKLISVDGKRTTSFSTTIEQLKERTTYTLELLAQNKFGKTVNVNPLKVQTKGKPDPPEQFCLVTDKMTESSIVVKWKPCYDGGYQQHFILVRSQEGHEPESHNIDITAGNSMLHTIENVPKKTHYTLELFAENKAGRSLPRTVETKGKPDPPEEFRLVTTDATESSIVVQWKPGYDGGYKQYFILVYSREAHGPASNNISTSYLKFMQQRNAKPTEKNHFILEIFAENQDRRSSSVKPPTNKPGGKPDASHQFSAAANDNTKPAGEKSKLRTIKITDGDFMQYKIKDLTKETHYMLELFAENQAGRSSPIKPLTVETTIADFGDEHDEDDSKTFNSDLTEIDKQ